MIENGTLVDIDTGGRRGIGTIQGNIGAKIKELRDKRGYSLGALAQKAGISKSTLYGIEEGKANPTISSIWAIANALDIPFGELTSENVDIQQGTSQVTLVDKRHDTEVYKMVISDEASVVSAPHMVNTIEDVVVVEGEVLIGELARPTYLRTGDHYRFKADVPHIYKALSSEVVLIVTINYPKKESRYFNEDIFWDDIDDRKIKDLFLEMQNGLEIVRVIVQNQTVEIKSSYTPHHNLITTTPDIFYLCSIFRGTDGCILKLLRSIDPELPKKVVSLYNGVALISRVLKTEKSLKRGHPDIDISILTPFKEEIAKHPKKTSFERRISVGLYGVFEYFHPGYGIQAMLLAFAIKKYSPDINKPILDIGTGPGQHLRLMSDIIPQVQYDVIEPSTHAIDFLKDMSEIREINNCFLGGFKSVEEYKTIISVGSSHHVPLDEFFSVSRELLSDDGVFIVCDEFIGDFAHRNERDRKLIIHHTQYMLEVMVPIQGELSREEKLLYDRIRSAIPYARYAALMGDVHEAKRTVISLFDAIKDSPSINELSDPLISYYLFIVLELEALVAGLDYEEECKTSVGNFVKVAEDYGFEVLNQACFHPTSDESGTYMVVLKKGEVTLG